MAKHVLLGSSYVSRLANNLKIPGHVFFMGKGGMKTDNIPTEFLTSIKRIQPDCALFIWVETTLPVTLIQRILRLDYYACMTIY